MEFHPHHNTTIFKNKFASSDYAILEKMIVGIELKGDEIKAIRQGRVQLKGSYGKILFGASPKPQLYLIGLYLGSKTLDQQRTRRLLAHRREINRLIGLIQQKKYTLIPIKLFFQRGKAKIELGVAKARKKWDKREKIKERDLKKSLRRAPFS